jgi:electron transport complex protein RnfD
MKSKSFELASSPHIRADLGSDRLKLLFMLSLLPVIAASACFFGPYSLLIILSSLVSALLTEIILQKLVLRTAICIRPGTAITGLLLGLILPSTVPLWLPAIGSAFAIAIAKYAFGVGNNLFNPALVGRAFLLAAWPVLMSRWAVDAVTSATPLAAAKLHGFSSVVQAYGSKLALFKALFIGSVSGSIGETSALAILVSAAFLFYFRVIDWRIPAAYLGTVFVIAFALRQEPVFHILSGGVLFAAVFMATDYRGSPVTRRGRLVFGFGCGLITILIRVYAGAPEGVTYAILLMNALSPLISRYTVPKPFGWKR